MWRYKKLQKMRKGIWLEVMARLDFDRRKIIEWSPIKGKRLGSISIIGSMIINMWGFKSLKLLLSVWCWCCLRWCFLLSVLWYMNFVVDSDEPKNQLCDEINYWECCLYYNACMSRESKIDWLIWRWCLMLLLFIKPML